MLFLSCIFSLFVLAACGTIEPKPVAIEAWDICANCKMAISQKHYAAELIYPSGEPFKFDDISCMLRYVKTHQDKQRVASYFVVDFDSQEWVKAEEACYVGSPEFKTPMGGGVVAFKERSNADAVAGRNLGELLRFGDLQVK